VSGRTELRTCKGQISVSGETTSSWVAGLGQFTNISLRRNLPNKGDEFLDMLNHPIIESFVPWFLGEGFLIYNMSANIALDGECGIHMHRDQSSMPPDQIDHSYMLNALWYLTDLTPEKGATLVYPGSHLKNVAPIGHMSDKVRIDLHVLSRMRCLGPLC
jgi:hypothetical protein